MKENDTLLLLLPLWMISSSSLTQQLLRQSQGKKQKHTQHAFDSFGYQKQVELGILVEAVFRRARVFRVGTELFNISGALRRVAQKPVQLEQHGDIETYFQRKGRKKKRTLTDLILQRQR